MFRNYFWIMIICILTTSCTKELQKNTLTPKKYKSRGPISRLVAEKASLGIAVNAETGRVVLLNSLTGKEQPSCGKPNLVINNYQKRATRQIQKKTGCEQEILHPSPELIKAIKRTQSKFSFPGVIRNRNGVEKTVSFHLILVSSNEGSYCSTHFIAGRQYENCVSLKEECDEYRNIDYPPSEATLSEFLLDYPECKGLIES